MIPIVELPEAYVLADQLRHTVVGRTIAHVAANEHPHSFAFYNVDPAEYHDRLVGRRVLDAQPGTGYTCGGNVELICEDRLIVVSTPIRYHAPGDELPGKRQLLIGFEDASHLSCTVQMWGSLCCYELAQDGSIEGVEPSGKPTPLESGFTRAYFDDLLRGVLPNISVKAFLATEQRIPGLGNGVLQDILHAAKLHPRTHVERLGDDDIARLYRCVVDTLREMALHGGRDTERDLFGARGGYATRMSNKSVDTPCPECGSRIEREAYLGGNVYFCPTCQPDVEPRKRRI